MEYLELCGPELLGKLLKLDLTAHVLGEIITALHSSPLGKHCGQVPGDFAATILTALSGIL